METIIVTAIVILSLVYLVRRFYRGFKMDAASRCASGCCGCTSSSDCTEASSCTEANTCSASD